MHDEQISVWDKWAATWEEIHLPTWNRVLQTSRVVFEEVRKMFMALQGVQRMLQNNQFLEAEKRISTATKSFLTITNASWRVILCLTLFV
jgi:hypothetical protein